MWLSVFIVFSLVVFVWFQGFQQKLTFLLDPLKESEMAEEMSPFVVIGSSFNDLKATILDLFGLASGTKKETEVKSNLEYRFGTIEPKLLPLSE